jgi:hypothetical protein
MLIERERSLGSPTPCSGCQRYTPGRATETAPGSPMRARYTAALRSSSRIPRRAAVASSSSIHRTADSVPCSSPTEQSASSAYTSIQRYVSGRRRQRLGASTSDSRAREMSPWAAATSPSPRKEMPSQHGSPTWQPRAKVVRGSPPCAVTRPENPTPGRSPTHTPGLTPCGSSAVLWVRVGNGE